MPSFCKKTSLFIFSLRRALRVKKSQMAGDDATHVGWLIGYCMRVPLSGTAAQEEDETRQLVASVAASAAAVYVCGFSSPCFKKALLGSAHLRGTHSTRRENFEASLSSFAFAAVGIRLHKYTPPFAISSRHLRQSRSAVVVFMGQEFQGTERTKVSSSGRGEPGLNLDGKSD